MKLLSGPLSMFGAKVEIALREKGVAFELEMVPFNLHTLYDPKHPDVLRVNPKRQVPVLIDGDLEIFDSTQIFEYLEDRCPAPPLWPLAPQDRARARLLELKSDEVFFPPVIRLMGLQRERDHPDAVAARSSIAAYYDGIERLLADRKYLAGPFTCADIAFVMAQFFAARMGAPMSSALQHLCAWRVRVMQRPAVTHVLGAMNEFLRRSNLPVPDFR